MSQPAGDDPGAAARNGWKRFALITGVLLILLVLWLTSLDDETTPTNVAPAVPSAPSFDLEVISCDREGAEFATAVVEVSSSEDLSFLAFTGDFTSEGVSIGQGIGNLSNVSAGQTYRTDVIYSLSGSPTGAGTCQVKVDYFYP